MEKLLSVVVEVTRSLSDVIKKGFVSFNDQKKTIKVVKENDPRILTSTGSINEAESLSDQVAGNESSMDVPDDQNVASGLGSVHDEENIVEAYQDQVDEAINKGYEEGFNQGKEEGYEVGYQEGLKEAENQMALKVNSLESENAANIEELKNQLIQEYTDYQKTLEPKMLSIIENLVVKLVGEMSVSKDTIMHLIRCGLDELEIHGDLIIKVSGEDLDYVIERRDLLTEDLSEKIKVEVLKDQQLKKNEVVIETEMGTIESSLGVQMEGLLRELRLIRESLEV